MMDTQESVLPVLDETCVSFVVIGYNEAATLPDCLRSARDAELPEGFAREVIFVDAGSADNSRELAEAAGVDQILGGEKRRRAAENRNLGLMASRGAYVQFLDGDMTMDPAWIPRGIALLRDRDDVAAVTAELKELGEGLVNRVLELDWGRKEGEIAYVGGAALWRAAPLRAIGGFPEDVQYGEEPYLCWRLRNEEGLRSYHLAVPMVKHRLGHQGLGDYWRRTARVGGTYAEIAVRCVHHQEKLWLGQCVSIALWGAIWSLGVLFLLFGGGFLRLLVILAAGALWGRKALQTVRRGAPPEIAALYALHTYGSKIPLVYGMVRWFILCAFRA